MTKRLSIIVPVYNCDNYIAKCLTSILDQEGFDEICELIIVDDGSTDKSLEIISGFKLLFPQILVLKSLHKGLSCARNLGLSRATGDYVFFIDSDDWISVGSINCIIKAIEDSCPDILLFNIKKRYSSGKERNLNFHLPKTNSKLMSCVDYISNYIILSAAWQGVYSRKLIVENQILFPEGLLSEDDYFVVELFSKADRIYYFNRDVYYYYQRPESITNSGNGEHNYKLIFDKLAIFEGLSRFVILVSEDRQQGLQRKLHYLALDILRLAIRKSLSKDQVDEILSRLTKIGYYPFKAEDYLQKHKFFVVLLSRYLFVNFFMRVKFFKIFL